MLKKNAHSYVSTATSTAATNDGLCGLLTQFEETGISQVPSAQVRPLQEGMTDILTLAS